MMNNLSYIIPDKIIYSIGHTFIQSLWQCTLIAIILWIILIFIGKRRASFRYIVSSAALFAMFIVTAVSFIKTYSTVPEYTGQASFEPLKNFLLQFNLKAGPEPSTLAGFQPLNEMIPGFIDRYYAPISLLWIIGILLLSARLTGNLVLASRLKKRGIILIPTYWSEKIEQLSKKIGLKDKVKILESLKAKVPMVIGVFKPVILFPAGVLASIPYEQVETILAHELAHIKRHDFLVNIFQSFVEIVLFYHPATWWITEIIRDEREICCDDIALTINPNPLLYVKALINLQELSNEDNKSVVAFTGKSNSFITRIKRITMMEDKKFNISGKWITISIVVTMISLFALLTGFTSNKLTDNILPSEEEAIYNDAGKIDYPSIVYQDTLRARMSSINTNFVDPSDNIKKRVRMEIKDGKVYELYIDDVKVPDENISDYQDLIDKTLDELEDAQADIEKAMKEVAEVDIKAIQMEVEADLKEVEEINMEAMQLEIEAALKEIEEIDMESMKLELEAAMKEIDTEAMKLELEKTLEDMEMVDFESINLEIEQALKEIGEINFDIIKDNIEHSMGSIHDIHIDSIMHDLRIDMKGLEDLHELIDSDKMLKELEESLREIENALPPEKKKSKKKD